jgi:hypothetical protein
VTRSLQVASVAFGFAAALVAVAAPALAGTPATPRPAASAPADPPPPVVEVTPVVPVAPVASVDPAAEARASRRPLAVTFELVSPFGAAGCVYQRRPVLGVLVAAGSLFAATLALYAAHQHETDTTLVGGLSYGLLRALGVAGAAGLDLPSGRPPPTAKTLALGYQLSF